MRKSVSEPASRLGGRFAFNLVLFGFIGQIAWIIENMYFNTFLYNAIDIGASQEAVNGSINVIDAVSKMVAYSAITAAVTTFLMGTLSDRIGTRKKFISIGYLIWGVIIALFGFVSRDTTAQIFGLTDPVRILTVTVWTVIVLDCVMTFAGSTANDANFNAWVTDSTNEHNRASAESILSLFPLAATGVVLGLGGFLISGDDKQQSYALFFRILGIVVFVSGLLGLFTLQDSPKTVKSNTGKGYFTDIIYGFRPSVIRENAKLYLTLAAICIYSIAVQVFFPYLIIYLEHSPDQFFAGGSMAITPALIIVAVLGLVVAVLGVLGIGKLIDRYGKDRFIVPVVALLVIGLTILYFAHDLTLLLIGVVPTAIGYLTIGIMLNAAIRDFTPPKQAGLFQGIRMIFMVMLPMVIGPLIGRSAILHSGATYLDDYGVSQAVPTSVMFLSAAITAAFTIIPVLIILKKGGFRPAVPQTVPEE